MLSTSTHAFTALKWLGVAYLVYLGLKQWRASPVPMAAVDRDATNVSARTLMVKGWAVNATNPKGLVFMMAVMPQFIDSQAVLWSQYLAIAATMACTDFVAMAIYTAFAARVLAFFRSEAQIRFLNRLFGGLFVAAATALATFCGRTPACSTFGSTQRHVGVAGLSLPPRLSVSVIRPTPSISPGPHPGKRAGSQPAHCG